MSQITDDEDFGALFEADNTKPRKRVTVGDRVSGTVLFIGTGSATVDLGDGLEALLDTVGLIGKDGEATLKPGDRVDAVVVRIRDRVVELAKTIAKGHVNLQVLADAAVSGLPVEGTITGVNKGGYLVDVSGATGFCPLGQMDTRRIADPATLVGQKMQFRVVEVRDGRDLLVLDPAYIQPFKHGDNTYYTGCPAFYVTGLIETYLEAACDLARHYQVFPELVAA